MRIESDPTPSQEDGRLIMVRTFEGDIVKKIIVHSNLQVTVLCLFLMIDVAPKFTELDDNFVSVYTLDSQAVENF